MKDGTHLSPTNDARPLRHRELDPSLGRWTRQDPLGYVDGANTYVTYRGAPHNHVDAFGLTSVIVVNPSGNQENGDHLAIVVDVTKVPGGPPVDNTGAPLYPSGRAVLSWELDGGIPMITRRTWRLGADM